MNNVYRKKNCIIMCIDRHFKKKEEEIAQKSSSNYQTKTFLIYKKKKTISICTKTSCKVRRTE